MPKKIALLVCHNLYDSKLHFTKKLAEAFERKGIEIAQYAWPFGPVPAEILGKIKAWHPDLTCSFNQPGPLENGLYFWDELKIPHWTILVDPVMYDLDYIKSPYSLLSSVDRNDCAYLRSLQFNRLFFFPHAIEKELVGPTSYPKTFDIVFPGTCYNPDLLRKTWKAREPAHVSKAINDAAEMVLAEKSLTTAQALRRSLLDHDISLQEVNLVELFYYIDFYTRGIDRIKLIQSIREIPVHIFGAKWKNEGEVRDWSFYLDGQKNVIVHPPVGFDEMIEVIKRSKVILNSMPFFKDGSHERVLLGLACGALPMTTRSQFFCEQFEDQKEILFYEPLQWNQVEGAISHFLQNEEARRGCVAAGQSKVLADHTWDVRVEQVLPLLDKYIALCG